MFSDRFPVLKLKIIFFQKKYYFDAFPIKNVFRKYLLLHFQIYIFLEERKKPVNVNDMKKKIKICLDIF
jgi:hypothetical protein